MYILNSEVTVNINWFKVYLFKDLCKTSVFIGDESI